MNSKIKARGKLNLTRVFGGSDDTKVGRAKGCAARLEIRAVEEVENLYQRGGCDNSDNTESELFGCLASHCCCLLKSVASSYENVPPQNTKRSLALIY